MMTDLTFCCSCIKLYYINNNSNCDNNNNNREVRYLNDQIITTATSASSKAFLAIFVLGSAPQPRLHLIQEDWQSFDIACLLASIERQAAGLINLKVSSTYHAASSYPRLMSFAGAILLAAPSKYWNS